MNRSTLKKVLHAISPYRFQVGLSIGMAFLTVVSTLYIPILIGDSVDCILGAGKVDFPALGSILLKMAVVILVTAVCQWVMNIVNNRIVYSVTTDLRRSAFDNIQHLPISYLDTHPYGDIVSRVVADVDQFADGLLMGFTQLFTGVMTILGTLIFMVSVNIWIALVVILITPLSLFVARFIAKRSHDHFKAQSESRGEETAFINEIIVNEKVVKAYGQEAEVLAKFDEINERLGKNSMKAIFFSSLTNPCTRFVNAIVYAGVGVFGALFVLRGSLSVGQLTCFLTYANQYTKPFNEISGVVTELQNAMVCAARLFELIEMKPEDPAPEKPAHNEAPKGHVVFDNVSFSYVPEKPLIRNLSLEAKPGPVSYTHLTLPTKA